MQKTICVAFEKPLIRLSIAPDESVEYVTRITPLSPAIIMFEQKENVESKKVCRFEVMKSE